MWKWYALLSAIFAALTAVLAKVGVRGVSGNVAKGRAHGGGSFAGDIA